MFLTNATAYYWMHTYEQILQVCTRSSMEWTFRTYSYSMCIYRFILRCTVLKMYCTLICCLLSFNSKTKQNLLPEFIRNEFKFVHWISKIYIKILKTIFIDFELIQFSHQLGQTIGVQSIDIQLWSKIIESQSYCINFCVFVAVL